MLLQQVYLDMIMAMIHVLVANIYFYVWYETLYFLAFEAFSCASTGRGSPVWGRNDRGGVHGPGSPSVAGAEPCSSPDQARTRRTLLCMGHCPAHDHMSVMLSLLFSHILKQFSTYIYICACLAQFLTSSACVPGTRSHLDATSTQCSRLGCNPCSGSACQAGQRNAGTLSG